jgi:3-ketosteroid 9alpha-monooxygenase subunit A
MATTKEYGLGEFTFPRGWFMVADAEEVQDKPISVRFFGQDLVIYRGQSGKVYMVEAYCAHMGAHLGKNTTSFVIRDKRHVEGESIRCPYHAWRYGPDGKCNEIPYYSGTIPKSACIKSWTIKEQMGIILAWYDPENGAPDYDAPFLQEWDDPSYVHWKIDHLGELMTHPQEMVDNIADATHLSPTHGTGELAYFENEFKDHIVVQRQGGPHRDLSASGEILETDTWYTGPGVLLSRMKGLFPSYILITHTPIDDGHVKAWHALLVKSPNTPPQEQDIKNARIYQEAARQAFVQDFEVWANKKACINPMQIMGDGPFHKLRTWYKQFYNPRAKVTEFTKKVNGITVTRSATKAAAE